MIPIPIPILAAGGAIAGWLVGHAAQGSEAAGDTEGAPAPAPTPDATSGGTASLDWGQDLSSGGGLLPGASPVGDGDAGYDYDTGNNLPTAPAPAPSPPPPTSSTPTPTPTGTLYVRPRSVAPPGAVGWTVVRAGQNYWNPVGGWNGGYPVHVQTPSSNYVAASSRWIGALHTAIRPNGERFNVRRVSHRDTVDGNWANDFVAESSRVYSSSTASVRI